MSDAGRIRTLRRQRILALDASFGLISEKSGVPVDYRLDIVVLQDVPSIYEECSPVKQVIQHL